MERWLLYAALALLAAWQLVPTWESLQPPRTILIPLFAGYLLLLMALLMMLPARLRGRRLGGLLFVTSVATALLVAYESAVTIGQVGFVAAAALLGCWIYALLPISHAEAKTGPRSTGNSGLVSVYAVLAGGLAVVGAVQLEPVRFYLLLAPAAPLLMWLFAFGPLAPKRGVWQQPDD